MQRQWSRNISSHKQNWLIDIKMTMMTDNRAQGCEQVNTEQQSGSLEFAVKQKDRKQYNRFVYSSG